MAMAKIARTSPRLVKITPHINPYADGSVIIEFGNTKIHITAIIEKDLPPWLKGQGKGWVTAEYSMLPGATHTRSRREKNGPSGRSQEIQRLIGRSLRAAIDLNKLGEVAINVDCDVLVADGGTRTASISGAMVALVLAINSGIKKGKIKENPIINQIAALSVGINKAGDVIADLNYEEDSTCETDMNIVMTKSGHFVEVQGTAEGSPFSAEAFDSMIKCAREALVQIFTEQDRILK